MVLECWIAEMRILRFMYGGTRKDRKKIIFICEQFRCHFKDETMKNRYACAQEMNEKVDEDLKKMIKTIKNN